MGNWWIHVIDFGHQTSTSNTRAGLSERFVITFRDSSDWFGRVRLLRYTSVVFVQFGIVRLFRYGSVGAVPFFAPILEHFMCF